MIRLLALAVLALVIVACSDRVPAPVTPTPSPRPGYPPAPVSELPEGVLFVQQPSSGPPLIFGIGPDGEARAYERGSIAVSPDGTKAAVVAMEKSIATGEWLATGLGLLTGSGYDPVVEGRWEGGTAPMVEWSPDGKRLAYTQPDEVARDKSQVWLVDVHTRGARRLTTEADHYSLLGWTAEDEVLVSTPHGLALLGNKRREIALPEAGDILDIEMSPDGRSVAVKPGQSEHNNESDLTYIHSSGIWIGELARGKWRRIVDLTGEPPEVQTTGGQEMQWSPDGSRISTHTTRHDEHDNITDALSVIDVRTGAEIRVRDQGWGWENWSPDGRYLAYIDARSEGSGGRRLGILGPDGRKREVEGSPSSMAWAGNGRLLVDIPGKLSVLDPETMEVKDVLTEEGKTVSVDIEVSSPSGRYVAAETGADQYHRSPLYVVDTETGTADLFLDQAGFSAVAWLRE